MASSTPRCPDGASGELRPVGAEGRGPTDGGAARHSPAAKAIPARTEGSDERERLSLSLAVGYLIDESRMVLPGIQALFGFQLIAVFAERFQQLGAFEQRLHFASIALVVIATALIMTPAAYHRHQEAREVTCAFIVGSTRLLLAGMVPLALALALDVYLVGQMILGPNDALPVALGLLGLLFFLWFAFPRIKILQRALTWSP